jgi:molecular chaperone Hsp33
MEDILIRGTALNGQVRVFAARTTKLIETLRSRHGTWPTATAALGRTATAAAMMGAMLKDGQKLTVQIKGNGPIGQIVADANAEGHVRGYVSNPFVDLPLNAQGKLDVAGAVGTEGFLYVLKDLGVKETYQGSVPLISGELAEDFTYYFAKSEQTPSAVALGVLVDRDTSVRAAGGYVIQLLPGVPDEEITRLEQKLATIRPVTAFLDAGMTPEQILQDIFPEVRILDSMPIQFRCQCSRDRVTVMLGQLGKDEVRDMIEKDEKAEVVCHFCNEKFHFTKDELKTILEKL